MFLFAYARLRIFPYISTQYLIQLSGWRSSSLGFGNLGKKMKLQCVEMREKKPQEFSFIEGSKRERKMQRDHGRERENDGMFHRPDACKSFCFLSGLCNFSWIVHFLSEVLETFWSSAVFCSRESCLFVASGTTPAAYKTDTLGVALELYL